MSSYSADGVNWNPISDLSSAVGWHTLAISPAGVCVAAGAGLSGSSAGISYSTDGSTWSSISYSGPTLTDQPSVAWFPNIGQFVIVGSSSGNQLTWTQGNGVSALPASWNFGVYGSGLYYSPTLIPDSRYNRLIVVSAKEQLNSQYLPVVSISYSETSWPIVTTGTSNLTGSHFTRPTRWAQNSAGNLVIWGQDTNYGWYANS
jgi:hypothetical protein